MSKKRLNPSIKRSRTRSGCLTCRDRHMKCDEHQPVCKNCIKLKRKCYRGIRLNFTQYTIYNPERPVPGLVHALQMSQKPDSHVSTIPLGPFKLLDQSVTIASLYENGRQFYEPYLHLHRPEDLRELDLQYQQDIYSTLLLVPASSYTQSGTNSVSSPMQSAWLSQFDPFAAPGPEGLENYDLANYLFKDSGEDPASGGLAPENPNKDAYGLYNQPEMAFPGPQTFPIASSFEMDPRLGASGSSEPSRFTVDVNQYIDLVHSQRYYRILDLFNDLTVWKSIVPNYCFRLSEDAETPSGPYAETPVSQTEEAPERANDSIKEPPKPAEPNRVRPNKLLLKFLLMCSAENLDCDIQSLLENQLEEWENVKYEDISLETFGMFEQLFVSLVLVLLRCLLKLENGSKLTPQLNRVLINQNKIFNKLAFKFKGLSDAKFRKFKLAIIISSMQSVMLLKFFIKKRLELLKIEKQKKDVSKEEPSLLLPSGENKTENSARPQPAFKPEDQDASLSDELSESDSFDEDRFNDDMEDISEEISYNEPTASLREFHRLSRFELITLNTNFKKMDFLQLTYLPTEATQEDDSPSTGDMLPSLNVSLQPQPVARKAKNTSDGAKLRQYFWYLIRLEYALQNPRNSTVEVDYNFIFTEQNVIDPVGDKSAVSSAVSVPILRQIELATSAVAADSPHKAAGVRASRVSAQDTDRVILPSDQGIAINLVREYIYKLINPDSAAAQKRSDTRIHEIFSIIDGSVCDAGDKAFWHRSFRWVLNDE